MPLYGDCLTRDDEHVDQGRRLMSGNHMIVFSTTQKYEQIPITTTPWDFSPISDPFFLGCARQILINGTGPSWRKHTTLGSPGMSSVFSANAEVYHGLRHSGEGVWGLDLLDPELSRVDAAFLNQPRNVDLCPEFLVEAVKSASAASFAR